MNVHDCRLMLTNSEKFAAQNLGLESDDRLVWSKNGMMKKEDGDYYTVFIGPKSRRFSCVENALAFLAGA